MAIVHLEMRISGNVQGVWFRKSAVEQAQRLDVRGYAMNLPDGSVRIEVEGLAENVDRFVEWCHMGPPRARVDDVLISKGEPVGYASFATRH